MNKDEKKISSIQEAYTAVLADVLEGKNLQKHLIDVEGAITEVNKSIAVAKEKGDKTTGLESVLNDIYYLKYEILERL